MILPAGSHLSFILVVLPTVASHKSQANVVKSKFSSDSHSDQIAMLRAFQGWQRAKREGREKVFCFKNFISPGNYQKVYLEIPKTVSTILSLS